MAPIPDPIYEFISPKWNVGAAIGRPRILSFVMRKTAPFRVANGRPYTFIVKIFPFNRGIVTGGLPHQCEHWFAMTPFNICFVLLTEREETSLSALPRSEK